jgi:SAM-dependent methyltransferase
MNAADLPALRELTAGQAWDAVHDATAAPYRRLGGINGRWSYHWARGKLGHDPVFHSLLEQGHLPPRSRVVDIGCGQGLLASLLHACERTAAHAPWPSAWPQPPSASAYTGIELLPGEVRRAEAALGRLRFASQAAPQFICADMRHAELPSCDTVAILDVLHYVNHAAQVQVLKRVRASLFEATGPGRLLLRVGDADNRRGFAISQWVDRVVTRVRGHRAPPTWGRPLDEWLALLLELGFRVQAWPMSQGTPFANVLLVADLRPA